MRPRTSSRCVAAADARRAGIAAAFAAVLVLAGSVRADPAAEVRFGPQAFGGGQFTEHCRSLRKGQVVVVAFEATAPVEFNIHYHAGRDTHHPVRVASATKLEHRFVADAEREYCWMWQTPRGQGTTLQYRLRPAS